MNKKILIKLICLVIVLMGICININVEAWNAKDTITTVDELKGDDNVENVTKNVMGTIISVIRIVGTGIAIVMITYVAIKYMSAAPQEKAEFKKSAMAMIVGAIVLFASTNILNIIADFATTNVTSSK